MSRLRMPFLGRMRWVPLALMLAHGAANAQVPFPPPALLSAPSVEVASTVIGASKPEFSSYLLLDVPEVSTEGVVHAVAKSELPGTTQLVVLRQFPVAVSKRESAVDKRRSATGSRAQTSTNLRPTTAKPPTVFIAAKQFAMGEPAQLKFEFDFSRNERFTVLAFAQGRWFGATREMKLARETSSDRP